MVGILLKHRLVDLGGGPVVLELGGEDSGRADPQVRRALFLVITEPLRHILQRGTSAHRQLKKYELERAGGSSDEDALKSVVDRLVKDTAEGL